MSPAVTLHTGMCRSKAVVRVIDRDRGKKTETYTKRNGKGQKLSVSYGRTAVEIQPRSSS